LLQETFNSLLCSSIESTKLNKYFCHSRKWISCILKS